MRVCGLRALGALLVPMLMLGAIACSDDDTDADDVSEAVDEATGATDRLCSSLDDLGNAVGEADSLSADSSVDDAREAQSNIEDALDEVRSAASGAASAVVSTLQTAYDALSNTLDDLPDDESLGDAASAVESQTTAIGNALDGLIGESGC